MSYIYLLKGKQPSLLETNFETKIAPNRRQNF